jgi:hypothetical protein
MARVPKDWERRLVELAAIHGVTDFLLRGRLTKAESKALYTMLTRLGKPAARTGVGTAARLGGTALSVGRTIAMRHPYITAGAVIYYAVKNREEIADLAREGWEVVEPAVAPVVDPIVGAGRFAYETAQAAGVYDQPPGIQAPGFLDPLRKKYMQPRKKSKYNRAMSKAMKAVKASTKGGRKGKISNPKTTFKTVSKVVSKVAKGSRVPTIGISGIAARAAKKVYGKIKKSKKKPKKRSKGYTIRVN